MTRTVQKWAAVACLSAGIGFYSVPAGLICAGFLTLLDAVTPTTKG